MPPLFGAGLMTKCAAPSALQNSVTSYLPISDSLALLLMESHGKPED